LVIQRHILPKETITNGIVSYEHFDVSYFFYDFLLPFPY